MIIIDGTTYNVPVIVVDETAEILDKYAERTEDGALKREIIGVFYNYQISFGKNAPTTELAALWNKLTEPIEFHEVVVPEADGETRTFTAYFANVRRSLHREEATKTFWRNMTANFISERPARTPTS